MREVDIKSAAGGVVHLEIHAVAVEMDVAKQGLGTVGNVDAVERIVVYGIVVDRGVAAVVDVDTGIAVATNRIRGDVGIVGEVQVNPIGIIFNERVSVDVIGRIDPLQEDTAGNTGTVIVDSIGENSVIIRLRQTRTGYVNTGSGIVVYTIRRNIHQIGGIQIDTIVSIVMDGIIGYDIVGSSSDGYSIGRVVVDQVAGHVVPVRPASNLESLRSSADIIAKECIVIGTAQNKSGAGRATQNIIGKRIVDGIGVHIHVSIGISGDVAVHKVAAGTWIKTNAIVIT